MLKIKTLILKNFQKHKDLTVDFNEEVNIITGLSNAGKSCIRRALGWVLFAENISENDLRKEGTKQTTVTVVFNNDVEVEKVRSASINRYILRRPNEDEQVFDKFGKEVPEEIRITINMNQITIENDSINLNIAQQLTMPFLLDQPASFRAKLFNKLTGNELLDALFKKCNKESLRISRELKETESNLEKQEDNLVSYSEQYKIDKKKLDSVKKKHSELKENISIHEKLNDLARELCNNDTDQDEVQKKLNSIVIVNDNSISDLRKKCEEYETLIDLNNKIEENEKALRKILEENVKIPLINFDDLKKRVELLEKLEDISNNFDKNDSDNTINKTSLSDCKLNVVEKETELKEVWKKCDQCPLCKGKIKHD